MECWQQEIVFASATQRVREALSPEFRWRETGSWRISASCFHKSCDCSCSAASWPRESVCAVIHVLYPLTVSPDAGQWHRLGIMCCLGFPAMPSLTLSSKRLWPGRQSQSNLGPHAYSHPPPPNFMCRWEALSLHQSQEHWGTTGFVSDHRLKPACSFALFPFFSKGSVRETKGNFRPWFSRQRSLVMAGCFQSAWVSGQYGFFFFF